MEEKIVHELKDRGSKYCRVHRLATTSRRNWYPDVKTFSGSSVRERADEGPEEKSFLRRAILVEGRTDLERASQGG